jgi:hypothetical protein
LSLPGCALASAISSCTLCTGNEGFTSTMSGLVAISPTGAKVLARVVTCFWIKRGIDGERAGTAEPERVAVGRRLGDLARADRAAGAAMVLDHDLLAERLAHELGDAARQHVVAAAGRVRNDQRYWMVGIVCAYTASGQITAMPPSSVMNARRRMESPPL